MGQKSGISALTLQKNFGIGSYRTAWKLLAKLRTCISVSTRQPLTGDIEVDEAYSGGVKNKNLIGIAAEKSEAATGRIRLKHLKSRKADEIQGFIIGSLAPGSKIVSDRFKSYPTIVGKGYSHQPMKKPYYWENVNGDNDRLLPRVHRVATLLKRWYLGTYHGGMDMSEIQNYLKRVFRAS